MIIIKSTDYISPDFDAGFLKGKEVLFSKYYKVPFYLHIISTPIALLIASIQYLFKSNQVDSSIHKALGITYVILVLFISAPSGFIMSFEAIGGTLSTISFLLLSSLWFVFTLRAYFAIRKGDIDNHRMNMNRSYLLILSAIFLRLYSFIFIHYFNWDNENMYVFITWLSWLPNLLLFEVAWFLLKLGQRKAV